MIKQEDLPHGLIAGEVIHLDPFCLPELIIISEEEADDIANKSPIRQFIITEIK